MENFTNSRGKKYINFYCDICNKYIAGFIDNINSMEPLRNFRGARKFREVDICINCNNTEENLEKLKKISEDIAQGRAQLHRERNSRFRNY